MAERSSWTGSAADLLRAGADRNSEGVSRLGTGWPKHPRALAGRLRRAQTFLRALGIEVAFGRGRAGSRVIRMHTPLAHTVSSAGKHGLGAGPPPLQPADDVCGNNYCPDLVGPYRSGRPPSRLLTMLTVLTQRPPFGESGRVGRSGRVGCKCASLFPDTGRCCASSRTISFDLRILYIPPHRCHGI
jgi:hypothetical protein